MKERLAEVMALIIVIVAAIAATTSQTAFAQKSLAYPYPIEYVRSIGVNDGWILEKSEFSGVGGFKNSASSTLIVGDDQYDRQYKSILHFKTGDVLSEKSTVLRAILYLRFAGVTGYNPFKTHGALLVDIRKPYFGSYNTLELYDFQAPASLISAGQFYPNPVNGWVSAVITKPSLINRTGTTQFRIYFKKDDNDDRGIDLLKFSSGSSYTKSYHPILEIEYENP